MLNKFFHAIFPHACRACKKQSTNLLCIDCDKYLNVYYKIDKVCPICASTIDKVYGLFNDNDDDTHNICQVCLDNNYKFTHTIALFENNIYLKALIYSIKSGDITLLKYLSLKLAKIYLYQQSIQSNNIVLPNIILPVPISNYKLYKRGYNQSLYIAKIISSILNIPYNNDILYVKNIDNKTINIDNKINRMQHLLNRKERLARLIYDIYINNINLSNLSNLNNLNILLVDDVMTTGATLNQLATILINNGAKSVSTAVLAKTPNINYYNKSYI